MSSSSSFLAGEVTAHALIKTAIEHGTAVAREVADRVARNGHNGVLDLCIVGTGPAGLACSLEAKRAGLQFVTLDQEAQVGGTVAKYPRRKLVMTQPVDLPLHGRLKAMTYTKEDLIDLWTGITEEHELPIEYGETFTGLSRDTDGNFVVHGHNGTYTANQVCLAVGRRGIPNRLGVAGEDLTKVAYSLLDARSYQDRRILVVGGGDSAVEAALGLAGLAGNEVTLAYRKDAFFRVRAEYERRLEASDIHVLLRTEVAAIEPDSVSLVVDGRPRDVPNDDVFIMAGGTPPFAMLQESGVSFDPGQRPAPPAVIEQGTGLVQALLAALALTVAALGWALWHNDYYGLPAAARPLHDKHPLLRPGMGAGLWFGIAAASMVLVNLLYLVRRAPGVRWFRLGSLRLWMTSHVATGVVALLCALMHAAMAPGDTVGGHALLALTVLLVTGAIGRYFYAWVPRAANGRELELADVKARLRPEHGITDMIDARQWRGSFFGRLLALVGVQRDLRRALARMEAKGQKRGVDEADLKRDIALARKAHRAALMAAHFEDLRALLASWRYLHRWAAALMVLLVAVHIGYALAYGAGW